MTQDRNIRLDTVIAGLISDARRLPSVSTVQWLCQCVQPVLLSERSLLSLDPPIRICGDIHGQFLDLLRVFELGGLPPNSRYLFLGDYVDRGERSVEVIVLLFALKARFPDSVFLLRGNHESPEMTELFGFADECKRKLEPPLWPVFLKTFDYLPIAAIVDNKFFCVHGGLSPHLASPSDILQIDRPTEIPGEGLMADLLWSDPNPLTDRWGPNERGATITWGLLVAREFMEKNKLAGIVRGHQMAMEGYSFPFSPHDRRVVTVFTASKYAGEFQNRAAYMEVRKDGSTGFMTLPKWVPHLAVPGQEKPKEKEKPVMGKKMMSHKARAVTKRSTKRLAFG
jgi:serine/threonine-protein phosphatase PP1 catalytic subunit